jgi:hypothetical protein
MACHVSTSEVSHSPAPRDARHTTSELTPTELGAYVRYPRFMPPWLLASVLLTLRAPASSSRPARRT